MQVESDPFELVSSLQNVMESIRTLFLVLLLSQVLLSLVDADPEPSTIQTYTYHPEEQGSTLTSAAEPSLYPTDQQNSSAGTGSSRGDCLIDTELGLIAVGSAGGLIVCLIVAVVVLVAQICILQRRVYVPRTSRSNMDLVSAAGYWATDRAETGGLVGPCDASVMLEEVRADSSTEEERQEEVPEAGQEAGAPLKEGATAGPQEEGPQMQGSTSRESCLEALRDLENMPLVV